MLTSHRLLAAQIFAHLALIPMIVFAEPIHYLIALLVYFANGCLGMTMTYHRLLSHDSWKAPKWFEYFGTFCATIGMTGSAISWVAIHRKHHRYTDTPNDPHSPSIKGFIYCQWLSMYSPVEVRYVTDLTRKRFYLLQHRYYFFINFLYAACLSIVDPFALIYAWLVPAAVLWNAGSSIVTLNHLFGSNPHSLTNRARNNWLLALLVWGEGWHNNHHDDPSNPIFEKHLDLGGTIITWLDPSSRQLPATVSTRSKDGTL